MTQRHCGSYDRVGALDVLAVRSLVYFLPNNVLQFLINYITDYHLFKLFLFVTCRSPALEVLSPAYNLLDSRT